MRIPICVFGIGKGVWINGRNVSDQRNRPGDQVPRELDHHCAKRMNMGADRIIERKNIRRLIYDFRMTEFMDSSGVGRSWVGIAISRLVGGVIRAIHVNDRVERLFHLAGIDKVIEIEKEKSWMKAGSQKEDSYGTHQ